MPDAMLLVARRLTFCILQRIAQPVYNLAADFTHAPPSDAFNLIAQRKNA